MAIKRRARPTPETLKQRVSSIVLNPVVLLAASLTLVSVIAKAKVVWRWSRYAESRGAHSPTTKGRLFWRSAANSFFVSALLGSWITSLPYAVDSAIFVSYYSASIATVVLVVAVVGVLVLAGFTLVALVVWPPHFDAVFRPSKLPQRFWIPSGQARPIVVSSTTTTTSSGHTAVGGGSGTGSSPPSCFSRFQPFVSAGSWISRLEGQGQLEARIVDGQSVGCDDSTIGAMADHDYDDDEDHVMMMVGQQPQPSSFCDAPRSTIPFRVLELSTRVRDARFTQFFGPMFRGYRHPYHFFFLVDLSTMVLMVCGAALFRTGEPRRCLQGAVLQLAVVFLRFIFAVFLRPDMYLLERYLTIFSAAVELFMMVLVLVNLLGAGFHSLTLLFQLLFIFLGSLSTAFKAWRVAAGAYAELKGRWDAKARDRAARERDRMLARQLLADAAGPTGECAVLSVPLLATDGNGTTTAAADDSPQPPPLPSSDPLGSPPFPRMGEVPLAPVDPTADLLTPEDYMEWVRTNHYPDKARRPVDKMTREEEIAFWQSLKDPNRPKPEELFFLQSAAAKKSPGETVDDATSLGGVVPRSGGDITATHMSLPRRDERRQRELGATIREHLSQRGDGVLDVDDGAYYVVVDDARRPDVRNPLWQMSQALLRGSGVSSSRSPREEVRRSNGPVERSGRRHHGSDRWTDSDDDQRRHDRHDGYDSRGMHDVDRRHEIPVSDWRRDPPRLRHPDGGGSGRSKWSSHVTMRQRSDTDGGSGDEVLRRRPPPRPRFRPSDGSSSSSSRSTMTSSSRTPSTSSSSSEGKRQRAVAAAHRLRSAQRRAEGAIIEGWQRLPPDVSLAASREASRMEAVNMGSMSASSMAIDGTASAEGSAAQLAATLNAAFAAIGATAAKSAEPPPLPYAPHHHHGAPTSSLPPTPDEPCPAHLQIKGHRRRRGAK